MIVIPSSHADAVLAYLQRPPRSSCPVVAEDLMRFCRHDFRRYVDILAGLARARGIVGVPLLINIHGTGGGRGLTYPIGVSQLLGTWRNRPGTTAGSDMYHRRSDGRQRRRLRVRQPVRPSHHRGGPTT